MPRITNRLNLPAPLVQAIANDRYEGAEASDYSTTSLIKPPRILALQRQHGANLEEDASDRIWALFGQVVHGIIERAATDELVEKRLFATVNGKTVSGQLDLYQGNILWDWKVTSIYSGKDGPKPEWVQQGNINRWLCSKNGIEVNGIQFVALYRDWSVMALERGKQDYPTSQVEIFRLPLWPAAKAQAFIESRITLHEAAKVELPLCTEEDRWARPEKWALMKKGQKRAVKLYETETQAEAGLFNLQNGTSMKGHVEYRPGESIRCLHFCSVSKYCTQFRDMMEAA